MLAEDLLQQYKRYGVYVGCLVQERRNILGKFGKVLSIEEYGHTMGMVEVQWENEQKPYQFWSKDLITL